MVDAWLAEAMASYNTESLASKDAYPGLIQMPGSTLETLVVWALQSLPDEILVGLDVDESREHVPEVDEAYLGIDNDANLFAGQGFVLGDASIVNRGDSYSVHHVPEEWTDGIFAETRGSRGGRFVHWLHTHPNAVAIPSKQDADAAQYTLGVDMILGIEFSPEGPLPWFDNVDGVRRRLVADEKQQETRPVLGIAPTGHRIHGLELIAFHRSGVGINVLFVDDDGYPYGWGLS